MSDFYRAIPIVRSHEGGYANNPSDPGGATNYGISLRFLASIGDLDGDGYLDGDLDHDGDVDSSDISALTWQVAQVIYKAQWWDRYGYGRIDDEGIATKSFDLAINMGAHYAHVCLQRGLRSALLLGADTIKPDGVLGTKTITAINTTPLARLDGVLCAFKSEAAGHYRSLVLRNPKLSEFLAGWENRAYS